MLTAAAVLCVLSYDRLKMFYLQSLPMNKQGWGDFNSFRTQYYVCKIILKNSSDRLRVGYLLAKKYLLTFFPQHVPTNSQDRDPEG